MGHFVVKSIKNLGDLKEGDKIETSDFATIDQKNSKFLQLEFKDDEEYTREYLVRPGVFCIAKEGMSLVLDRTEFVKDSLLDDLIDSQEIESKIDCFFNRLSVYTKLGFEVPKRAMLLYGPPGTGKTSNISKVCRKYIEDGKTAVVTWATDRYDPYDVKEFIKSFKYEGVEKLIFVAEDIGGVEMEEVRVKSDPSLLSLLDNQEKTFKIPVMILATTNHPEMFLGNLANRPNRFDDKIKVGFPSGGARQKLLSFFAKDNLEISEEALKIVGSDQCKEFSPAHMREIVIRCLIYDKEIGNVVKEMLHEIETYKADFADKKHSGMGFR